MRVCFFTLGCKVNQNETGALQQLFHEHGYDIIDGEDIADVYVVNSCTVTATGDKKSLQWLRRAKRNNPNAITVLTGCYPQAFPEKAKDAEADIITGNSNRNSILTHIKTFMKTSTKIVDIMPHLPENGFEQLPVNNLTNHTRAFMKIQDGCNRACSYCIIPTARGKVRSLAPETVIEQCAELSRKGFKEVVISGINLSCYGIDIGTDFASIIERISYIDGIERIRLGSIEPDLLPLDTLVRLSKIKKLCPQFHLSLQSGCDRTLKRMNRMYTSGEYLEIITSMRSLFPTATFTTDVIVGFPDETQEEFIESMEFVKRCNFLKVHVFSYSVRQKTPAATMPNQIPNEVKSARNKQLTAETNLVRADILKNLNGTTETVLLEKAIETGLYTGYTSTYIPVLVETHTHKQGDIVTIKLGEFQNGRCQTTVI